MLEGFEGQVGGAPGEGVDDLGVRAEDIEGGAHVLATEEVFQNAGCVIVRGVALEDGTGGFEELR